MTPSIRHRLDSVACSLSDVIIPTLQGGLAKEQAELALCQIKLLRDQVNHAALYEWVEYEEAAALAVRISARAAGGSATKEAQAKLSELIAEGAAHLAPDTGHEAWAQKLGFAIEAMVEACNQDGTKDTRRHVSQCVLAYERNKVRRDRAMFKGVGFDAADSAIDAPSLAEILRDDQKSLGSRKWFGQSASAMSDVAP